jgi:RimK family alpha-L-glutamate ligase
MPGLAIVAHSPSATNRSLGEVLTPAEAVTRLRAGEVAVGRLDVLGSLEGIERGLWALDLLERKGVVVLNSSRTLTLAHDKAATATALAEAAVPHPRTWLAAPWLPPPLIDGPVVLKPRFGSWGRDVVGCLDAEELWAALAQAALRPWFRSGGAVVQELVPPAGYDLRVLVARGEVAGAVHRVAAVGQWRTNIALGGRRVAAQPSEEACELARRAAAAVGGQLVGVDLLPLPGGGWVVLEVNGAVDFSADYALDDRDVFVRVSETLLGSSLASGSSVLASA